MSYDAPLKELSVETHEVLRFLLRDHAFSEEFLVTAVQEYFQQNTKGEVMQPHQERIVAEKRELDDKLEKLGLFIGGKVHAALPTAEQQRLRRQFDLMQQYSGVLQERIDHFPG